MKIPLKKRIKDFNIFSGMGRKFLLYFIFFSIIPIVLISLIGFKVTENIVVKQNINYLDLQNEVLSHRLESFLIEALDEISSINSSLDSISDSYSNGMNIINYKDLDFFQALITQLPKNSKSNSVFSSIFLCYSKYGELHYPDSILFILPKLGVDISINSSNQIQLLKDLKHGFSGLLLLEKLNNSFSDSTDILICGIIYDKILTPLFELSNNFVQKNQTYVVDRLSKVIFSPDNSANNNEEKIENIFSQNKVFFKRWDGENVLRRYKNLKFTNLYIVSDVTFQNAMNDIIIFRHQAIFGVGGLLIILIGLAFYFSQKITVPIRQLVYSAQDIGDGLLDAPIRINTRDEIGILANELDKMRLNLLDYYENLEKKVETRTNELRKVQFQIAHQEKMASIGLLAAGIAHEIGNPLTSISSLTQLLNRRLKDEKNLDYLSTIMKNIDRISKIVRELVDFCRPSNFEVKHTDINEVVRAAVGIVKYDSRSKNITFDLDLHPNLPQLVLVSDQLLQVLINILFNAVDAMEGFGKILKAGTILKENCIWIFVEDSGKGISEADLHKIFEPFYTTKEVGKGTGLGLSVSYGIIKNFHGEIKVESEVGKGSVFKVKLPIRKETKE